MLRVHPFKALRPEPTHASRVSSVPYDVVNTAEARAMAAGNPDNWLHVIRAEIDLPEDADPYSDAVYAKASENFARLQREGVLVQDVQPCMYVYRQVRNHRPQTGLVCCCHIDDYANDIIKKHEKTRRDKEDDRTRLTLELNANTGPVFLAFRDRPEIERLLHHDMNQRPLYHFNSPDKVTHTVWPVQDVRAYERAFGALSCAYVADGHHRAASAARAGAQRRAHNPKHTGNEEYNWFMCALFPASDLTILPYNRVVTDLHGNSPEDIGIALSDVGTISQTSHPEPERPGTFGVYLAGQWHRLELDPASIDLADPIASLDVSLLQERVLEPILGIGDPRTDKRISFVGGIRGTQELEKLVNSGEAAIAFAMHPTTMDQLMGVADAGQIMPPKSTWFEPKLRSGLFVHLLD
jgi:uncharacterized protein (DUF1015 family)